ncbi:MAG TPA: hypothetical protein VNN08_03070 [Thermoanaerobaculia bacterium]|nr:hypothetical protein [Thermoanaerobaculia bacterium]
MSSLAAVAFGFGLIFVVTLLALAIRFPHPTSFQYTIFRSVFALAGAGVAATIPGFVSIDVSAGTGLLIRAGGALAVFVILFFFNPARLVIEKATHESPPAPPSLSNGEPFREDMRDAFNQVWRALIDLERAGEDLWQRVSYANLAVFADKSRETAVLVRDHALFFSDSDYDALKEALGAADFYLRGKTCLSDIPHIELATPDEQDRFVNHEVRRQIAQNKRWLTRYRNILSNLRSSLHEAIIAG